MIRATTRAALLVGVVATLAGAGCTPPPTPYVPPAAEERAAERVEAARLGPGDVFEVRVYGEKELSGTHRVAPDGTISVPLVGTVDVIGLTPAEVGAKLEERFRDGYLREPNVTVFVKEYNSKRVFVLGSVLKPGTFPYEENMSIIQAITLAGGFKDLADPNGTVVTRAADGEDRRYIVPVEKITRGEHTNFVLRPGDIVFVPEGIL
jgi:polysaccharide export outer membrane protein